ncbi:TadE/TadG family type IV pilus assembly protein [Demequina aestuarii]|uniref:TadE/TadG family type IV pilus assembly protein n=1 Tax=Demequina aestuarii TaxID=327095 RepID=UPI000B0F3838|nr:TadE/TadG family type IV pilus assembly protein [Demequina aestuarii]
MEFVLVGILVVLIGLAVLQLVLALHVRNTLLSSAYEGARHGARADRSLDDGVARSEEVARTALGSREVVASAARDTVDGAGVVVVTLESTVPLVGLWGPGTMRVEARAFDEASGG